MTRYELARGIRPPVPAVRTAYQNHHIKQIHCTAAEMEAWLSANVQELSTNYISSDHQIGVRIQPLNLPPIIRRSR